MELSAGGESYFCREVYEEGAALLAGLEDGRLDARLLLAHFCGIETHRLLADPDIPVPAAAREAFLGGIRRRAAREPLAYITGEQFFMGLPFVVSPDVLIPEQDTENLVEEALRVLEDESRILDLCTGSGCILLSLLHYSNGCRGVGTDLSPAALRIAEKNARALGLEQQTMWLEGDLFDALSPLLQPAASSVFSSESGSEKSVGSFGMQLQPCRFDMIISNPPYIPSKVIDTLAPEVRCAEPVMALDGGPDGLDFYRRIISEAPGYLVIGGRLMLEIGYDQGGAVEALLREAGYYGVEILQDYGGRDRIATAVKSISQER